MMTALATLPQVHLVDLAVKLQDVNSYQLNAPNEKRCENKPRHLQVQSKPSLYV